MRIFEKTKDGGELSTVDAYFLIELKGLFSIALLKFNKGSRVNYHSHAFNALTWFIKGDMTEHVLGGIVRKYKRSLIPKLTGKSVMHKVVAKETSWCLTIRGKWDKTWEEYDPTTKKYITLESGGRKVVSSS